MSITRRVIIASVPREYPEFPIPSVGVLVVKDRRALLVQRGHEPSAGRWTIPGGVIEVGESIHEAGRRELREETGYTAKNWRAVVRTHLSNSVTDEDAIIYLATDLQAGDADPEPTERLRVRWLPFETALQMTLAGEITDAISVLGLQRVALLRRESHDG